jgi:hypothetical protein
MLVDSQEAQAQDAAILKEQLNTLEKNNANLLRTLGSSLNYDSIRGLQFSASQKSIKTIRLR